MEVTRDFPDAEIIASIQAGKRMDECIKSLYRNHFEGLSYYITRNNGSRQDAEDIFQEVLVSFIELVQKNKFRGESSIRTFLFSINRHCWLNELKRRGRSLAREEKFEKGQERTETDTSQLMIDLEGKAEISKLVASLGETCRTILLLFYYEELSMKEILEATDYGNEQVVRNKKYKCLKQLEKMLNEQPHLKESLKILLHG
jgi:RNA polymerase sigma factor (sigma-70 family)